MPTHPTDLARLTRGLTDDALRHGDALPERLMQRLGGSRRRALALVRRAAELGWLAPAPGSRPRRARWQPGPLREVVRRYALAGLEEDLPWRRDFAPCFALPPAAARIARHAFTELVNNAVDHSGGTQVTVSVRQTPLQLQLLVADDGRGLFDHLAAAFALDDPALAVLELSKGRLTSDPARHRGHGLALTSRLADVFDLRANDHAFQRRDWSATPWHALPPSPASARRGTAVYFALALDTARTLDAVQDAHAHAPGATGLAHTTVPLHLLALDGVLASRAEARRAAHRLDGFVSARLDFSGVAAVGDAFVDELFRVQRAAHPRLALSAVGMSERVAAAVHAAGG